MAKYRICRRHSPCYAIWYVVQKKRLFGWHSYNISFRDVSMAQQFIDNIDCELLLNKIVEIPLMIWDARTREYVEQLPYNNYDVKIR